MFRSFGYVSQGRRVESSGTTTQLVVVIPETRAELTRVDDDEDRQIGGRTDGVCGYSRVSNIITWEYSMRSFSATRSLSSPMDIHHDLSSTYRKSHPDQRIK